MGGSTRRFWCRPTDSVTLAGGGYLVDPEAEYSPNAHLRTLDEVVGAVPSGRAVVLLGEPGLGKTTELEGYRRGLVARTAAPETVHSVDLTKGFASVDDLVEEVFEADAVTDWRQGGGELHLLLDGLDECQRHVRALSGLLPRRLPRLPVDRLRLVLVCRTAEWPAALEQGLRDTFGGGDDGDDPVEVRELVGLRRTDAAEIAAAEGVDPDAFLAAVDRVGAAPLAVKPVTLRLLLRVFRDGGGSLPADPVDLYERGLTVLCDESDRQRRASAGPSLGPTERLAVAGRLATVTTLTGAAAVWTGPIAEASSADVTVDRFVPGEVRAAGGTMLVTDAAARETLSTGLFSSRGGERLGWAHQTYAEHLTARHLHAQEVSLAQVRNLLGAPDAAVDLGGDDGPRLVPALRAVAAWLTVLAPDAYGSLLVDDPDAYASAGIGVADEGLRARVVERLLYLARSGRLLHRFGRDLRRLDHPRLAERLREVLRDPDEAEDAVYLATDVAEANEVREVADDLARLALDRGRARRLRINAAYAVVRLDPNVAAASLRSLAVGEAGDDPDDEFKGLGLRAAWPRTLSTKELFGLLTRPKVRNLFGAYRGFLLSDLPSALQAHDLPAALHWLEGRYRFGDMEGHDHTFEALAHRIILLAWEESDDRGVRARLADVLIAALQAGHDHLDRLGREAIRGRLPFYADACRRRRVLSDVLTRAYEKDPDRRQRTAYRLARYADGLVDRGDFLWLLERYDRADESECAVIEQLLPRLLDPGDRTHAEAVFALDSASRLYQTVFAGWVEPVPIDSRPEWFELSHEQAADRAAHQLSAEALRERLLNLLVAGEAGDTSAWWKLNLDLTIEPDTDWYGDELAEDVTGLPGWSLLRDDEHDRLVDLAERYLRDGRADTDSWLGTNTLHPPALAGYRALALLARRASDRLDRLPSQAWGEWAAIVVAYPDAANVDVDPEVRVGLLRRTWSSAPDEVLRGIRAWVDEATRTRDDRQLFGHRPGLLRAIWDERLASRLVGLLDEPDLGVHVADDVLDLLVEHRNPHGLAAAHDRLGTPVPEKCRPRAVAAATSLLRHDPTGSWRMVWAAVVADDAFGRELFLHVADRSETVGLIGSLSEDALADAFVWLRKRFPPEDDPVFQGAHFVGPREALGEWRDRLLGELADRGTVPAVTALWRVVDTYPTLRQMLLRAEETARQHTWTPPTPEYVLHVLADASARLVRDGADLLRLLLDALDRLQQRLQGSPPEAQFLWNEVRRCVRRPKSEDAFSDYVGGFLKQDLQDRGLVVDREVQVRRGGSSGIGERTDLLVTAVRKQPRGDGFDTVTVVIEAKGCWNDGLHTAMREQLRDRYLREVGTPYGLYLVAWFDPDDWDPEDGRRAKACRFDLVTLSGALEQQALELSTDRTVVRACVVDASYTLPAAEGRRR